MLLKKANLTANGTLSGEQILATGIRFGLIREAGRPIRAIRADGRFGQFGQTANSGFPGRPRKALVSGQTNSHERPRQALLSGPGSLPEANSGLRDANPGPAPDRVRAHSGIRGGPEFQNSSYEFKRPVRRFG